MRICYIADAGSIHTQRWVKYFVDKGHEVHLISPRPFGANNIEGVKLHVFQKVRPQIRIISVTVHLLLSAIQLRRLLNRVKPDILHAHQISLYAFLGALSGFHPLLLSAWGSDVLVAPRNSRLRNLAVRFALKKADLVSTTSQYLKDYLHKEFALPQHKVIRVPWGIDLGTFRRGYEAEVKELRLNLGVGDSSFVILSPRHLKDHYRIERIVQAMPYILAGHPNVVLILLKGAAQDSKYEGRIDRLVKDLHVADNVRLVRRELNPTQMAVLYNLSDALISIPKSDQFSSSIEEGMVCGTIPVVADLKVYHHYLRNGGNAFLVNPEDPKEIAERVICCIEHPELKKEFYALNRRIVQENEDRNKHAPRMEQLYERMVSAKARPM